MTACVGGDMRANMDVVVIDERRIVEIQFFNSSIRRLTLILKKVVMPLTKPIRFGPEADIDVSPRRRLIQRRLYGLTFPPRAVDDDLLHMSVLRSYCAVSDRDARGLLIA